MAGKHQKMYFSFFKIALFVLPIIGRVFYFKNRNTTVPKHKSYQITSLSTVSPDTENALRI